MSIILSIGLQRIVQSLSKHFCHQYEINLDTLRKRRKMVSNTRVRVLQTKQQIRSHFVTLSYSYKFQAKFAFLCRFYETSKLCVYLLSTFYTPCPKNVYCRYQKMQQMPCFSVFGTIVMVVSC